MADSLPAMNAACMSVKARALWTVAAGRAELRTETLGPLPKGQARVRTRNSLISRGTERLVFHGLVGESEWERMRAPLQTGDFPFPVKYGYCAVGKVEDGPADLVGRTVFALHPHQDLFQCDVSWLTPVPEHVPPRRAVLAANMETALNALWDGGAGPGDRIVVVGAGVVGLLVAYLAASVPGTDVTVVDRLPERAAIAKVFGAGFAGPEEAPANADIVFHASANAAGLATALKAAGDEGTVVELSWYGDKHVNVPLGCVFHSQRLKLISSQVGKVAPSRRPRWSHARRLGKALELLADPRLEALVSEEVAFEALPETMPRLFAPEASGLTAVVRY
jgi:NADPH:quinone reductase-like Zn-dependent oxidoreductase